MVPWRNVKQEQTLNSDKLQTQNVNPTICATKFISSYITGNISASTGFQNKYTFM